MTLHPGRNAPILEGLLQESTVLESVRCPSCLTHYGLRPERVRPGLRKARCLTCKDVFKIEEAVERILAAAAPPEPAPELEILPPVAAEPAPEPPALPDFDPALTLGDLEGTEDEILEKTLVVDPGPAAAPAASEPEPEPLGGSFASAKDAISKLLGDLPEAPAHGERRGALRPGQPMDVEATLDALENTLGGTPVKDLDGPAPQGSTVKLSAADIQAAMAAGAGAPPPPAPPTVAIERPAVPAPTPAPSAPAAASDAALLKIEVGGEVYQNATLDQVTAWIEQGRIQEWHMVARQHSENWIEASKVPSLRPIFERVRRQQGGAQDSPFAPTMDTAPVKKGLFGFLKR